MKYKVGDRVMMRSLQWCKENIFNNEDKYPPEIFRGIEKFCGKILMISDAVDKSKYVDEGYYNMAEDTEWEYYWTDEMIEGLVEEDVDLIPKFGEFSDNEPLDIPTMTTDFIKEHGLPCPEEYVFKDENGNVINATKIVLEKKKKEYPKSFGECCKVLDIDAYDLVLSIDYRSNKMKHNDWKRLEKLNALNQILICRDAYWKLYGEELGLGGPWEPDWEDENQEKYIIGSWLGTIQSLEENFVSHPFAFPTEEMRDAFYENFKSEIEICKELL